MEIRRRRPGGPSRTADNPAEQLGSDEAHNDDDDDGRNDGGDSSRRPAGCDDKIDAVASPSSSSSGNCGDREVMTTSRQRKCRRRQILNNSKSSNNDDNDDDDDDGNGLLRRVQRRQDADDNVCSPDYTAGYKVCTEDGGTTASLLEAAMPPTAADLPWHAAGSSSSSLTSTRRSTTNGPMEPASVDEIVRNQPKLTRTAATSSSSSAATASGRLPVEGHDIGSRQPSGASSSSATTTAAAVVVCDDLNQVITGAMDGGAPTDTVPTSTAAPNDKTNDASNEGGNGSSGGYFECNICFEDAREPVVTRCGHLYCWDCLHGWLMRGVPECPVCKAGATADSVIPLYGRGSEGEDPRKKPRSAPERPRAERMEPPRRSRYGHQHPQNPFGWRPGSASGSFTFGFFPFGFGFTFGGDRSGGDGGTNQGSTDAHQAAATNNSRQSSPRILVIVCLDLSCLAPADTPHSFCHAMHRTASATPCASHLLPLHTPHSFCHAMRLTASPTPCASQLLPRHAPHSSCHVWCRDCRSRRDATRDLSRLVAVGVSYFHYYFLGRQLTRQDYFLNYDHNNTSDSAGWWFRRQQQQELRSPKQISERLRTCSRAARSLLSL